MRQFDLVERLLDRAVEALCMRARMMSEYGEGDCNGEARGFYEAAQMAADLPFGWPDFDDWKAWMLEALTPPPIRTGRDWHRCKKCNTKVYAPSTRCDCGGELYGITYALGAA